MGKPAADETKPFQEKYEAREILNELINEIKESWLTQSAVVKTVKALLYNRLGQNFYDAEEISESESQMQKSLALWLQVPKALQLRFSHSIQDVYNGIGIVLANRENNAEALPYLTKSIDTYEAAIAACKEQDKEVKLFSKAEDYELSALDRFLLAKEGPNAEESKVDKVVDGGLELNVLEAGYTQTLFYLAQVYSQKGDVEQGIKYCAQTMTRQMANKTYQIKDFSVNCLNLANYFVLQKNFAQAEYLLYTAQTLLPED